MTSRMTNTNVIRIITSVIWRSTQSKLGTSHPKKTTNASVISTTHMKTATCTIRRTLIILKYPIACLRIHSNYRQTKLIARHTKRNKNQISEILKKEFSTLDDRNIIDFIITCIERIRNNRLLLKPSFVLKWEKIVAIPTFISNE
jgi:hypothetical protein